MKDWWTIAQTEKRVVKLGMRFNSAGDVRTIGLFTDLHWDNAHCRLDLLKQALALASGTGTPCFFFGDVFCAMQGKWDKRASQDALRPEHRGNNYLDRLVDTAIEWFEPYKDCLALVTPGNHEAAIRKRHETDLISRFVGGLRSLGSRVEQSGYWGFIQACAVGPMQRADDLRVIHYHHGYGGGGEVTRGLIDHSRTRGQYLADVYVSGHIHRRNLEENIITRLSNKGTLQQRQQLFLRSSCWKDESSDEWHSGLMGRGARPIGGWWLEFHIDKRGKHSSYQISKMVPVMV